MPDAQRRETPEETPAIHHVEEREDHFIVTDSTGAFRVEKSGLAPDTLAHIQGMAHGGLVGGIAGGVRVDSGPAEEGGQDAPPVESPDDPDKEPGPRQVEILDRGHPKREAGSGGKSTPLLMAEGGGVPDAGAPGSAFLPYPTVGPPDAGVGGMPVPAGAMAPPALPGGQSLLERMNGGPLDASQLFAVPQALMDAVPEGLRQLVKTTGAGLVLDPLAQAGRALAPQKDETLPDTSGPWKDPGMPPMATEDMAKTPAAPPAPAATLPGGGTGQVGELNKGLAEQRAALLAQAEVEKQRGAALLQLSDSHIAQMQGLEAAHAEQMAAHQRRADDLFQATLNAKIDPNRVWTSADVGQRIGAGIGIILSGIGQSMGGGPNLALQQIDRTIDRDIDAQKTNLENQRSLLSHYLQQGRDMVAAHQLAKADLKDMLAAQMMRVSAQFGGQEAAARAQLVSGQLRSDAAMKRSEILTRDFAMSKERLALQLAQEQQRLLGTFLTQPRAPGGGLPADEAVWEMMPKDMRERRVRLPGGGWGLAADKEQAGKVADGLRAADELKRNLQRYSQLHQSGKPRIPSALGGDAASAEQIRGTMTARLKDLEKLGAISKGDYELIEQQIPDISSWTTGNTAMEQKLSALGSAIDDAVASQMKALGVQ